MSGEQGACCNKELVATKSMLQQGACCSMCLSTWSLGVGESSRAFRLVHMRDDLVTSLVTPLLRHVSSHMSLVH